MNAEIRFCTLSSGSSGNATYVGAGGSGVLVDAGISAKRLTEHLQTVHVPMESIQGLLITHAHIDHVRSMGTVARKFGKPLFMTSGARQQVGDMLTGGEQVTLIRPDVPFQLGSLVITPVATPHDSPGAVCYVMEHGGVRVGVLTDLGCVFDRLRDILPTLDGVVLESNHEPEMLWACARPYPVKQRIAGDGGHISNQEAAKLLRDHSSPRLRAIVLAHLSSDNNHPGLATRRHAEIAAAFLLEHKPLLEVAPRDMPSRMLAVRPVPAAAAPGGAHPVPSAGSNG